MFKPGDIVILVVIALVTWFWAGSGAAGSTDPESLRIVTKYGEDTLSLNTDTLVVSGSVTIEIVGGHAAITDSDCPTHQCVRTGWLESPGQMSACMPNQIFIEVLGSSVTTDAVTY